jgi:hypothetical protein
MSTPAEILQPPPPTMRDKVGPRGPALDADAIARAESALKDMSGNFQSWIAEDVEKLDAARHTARAAGYSEETAEAMFARAHDLKGLGTTYEYPLVTAIAGSLCRLLESPEARAVTQRAPALAEAHVEAVRAIVRDRARAPDHPVGKAIAEELRARVEDLLGPPSD